MPAGPLEPPVDAQADHVRGPAGARVTVVEYGDFECPYCAAAYPGIKELQRRVGSDLRFVFRHLPLTARHPRALAAAESAEAADAQGRFWEMHDALFESGRALGASDLRGHAEAIGLDLERYDAAVSSHVGAERVARDVGSARLSGVSGTPALFIDGKRYEGFYDAESLEDAVRDALDST